MLKHASLRLSMTDTDVDKTWRVNGSGNVTEYHVVVIVARVYSIISVAYLMFSQSLSFDSNHSRLLTAYNERPANLRSHCFTHFFFQKLIIAFHFATRLLLISGYASANRCNIGCVQNRRPIDLDRFVRRD